MYYCVKNIICVIIEISLLRIIVKFLVLIVVVVCISIQTVYLAIHQQNYIALLNLNTYLIDARSFYGMKMKYHISFNYCQTPLFTVILRQCHTSDTCTMS